MPNHNWIAAGFQEKIEEHIDNSNYLNRITISPPIQGNWSFRHHILVKSTMITNLFMETKVQLQWPMSLRKYLSLCLTHRKLIRVFTISSYVEHGSNKHWNIEHEKTFRTYCMPKSRHILHFHLTLFNSAQGQKGASLMTKVSLENPKP